MVIAKIYFTTCEHLLDDYGVARSKAFKAENTSDLNTDDGDYGQSDHLGKRTRKKKILSSSGSEDDEPRLGVLVKKRQQKIKKLPAPPTWMEAVDDTYENVENSGGNNLEGRSYVKCLLIF